MLLFDITGIYISISTPEPNSMSIITIAKESDYLLQLDLFRHIPLTDTKRSITKYVNMNVESIIRVLLDFLEDDSDFTLEDFLPYNLRINNGAWNEMVYDLYEIISSDVIRDYIKPKYEFLLYVILEWWVDLNSSFDDISQDMFLNKLDSDLAEKIQDEYTSEDGDNYVLHAITNFEEYNQILFADHDSLPDSLDRLIIMYLKDPKQYKMFFSDVDLKEYRELMPKDLREQFEALSDQPNEPREKEVSEATLLHDLFSCVRKVQANHMYKDSPEDGMNDYIRDLLDAKGYVVRDQTRQGTSKGGKQAGEVDILIRDGNRTFAIIEALKLSSLNQKYISEHIDKIYKYDTLGNKCNFIISYVKINDFNKFWKNHILLVESHNYPFQLINFTVPEDNQHPELKWALAELERNDIVTRLYHIVVRIP